MFLSDIDIKKGVDNGSIIIKPFDEKKLQIYPNTRIITIADGEEFVLHPGENVLGKQKEFIGVDLEHLILLSGKSSLARIGLVVHNTAMLFNPGHKFYPTFELVNSSNIPIILRPGMEIAQLIFGKLTSPATKSYEEVGRFDSDNSNHFASKK